MVNIQGSEFTYCVVHPIRNMSTVKIKNQVILSLAVSLKREKKGFPSPSAWAVARHVFGPKLLSSCQLGWPTLNLRKQPKLTLKKTLFPGSDLLSIYFCTVCSPPLYLMTLLKLKRSHFNLHVLICGDNMHHLTWRVRWFVTQNSFEVSPWHLKLTSCHGGEAIVCDCSQTENTPTVDGIKFRLVQTVLFGHNWMLGNRQDKFFCDWELVTHKVTCHCQELLAEVFVCVSYMKV